MLGQDNIAANTIANNVANANNIAANTNLANTEK